MTVLGGILIAIAAIALVTLFFSYTLLRYGVYRQLPKFVPGMRSQKKKVTQGNTTVSWAAFSEENERELEWFESLKPETLTVTSFDGLKLYAEYLPSEGSDRTVLLINGYRSRGGKSDFGNVLRRYHELGYNLLTCEQRAHGRSEGKYIGFGVPERFDVKSWTEMLVERFSPEAIYLHGISMGCATVLMATGTGLPAQVKGVIADCGYTSPWDICVYQVREQFHLPIFPVLYVTNWLDKRITGYSLREYSSLEAMKVNTVPILFIHGGCDRFVPTWMGKENYEACKADKKWVCAEDAGHGMSLWVERDRMLGEIEGFLREHR